MNTTWDNNSALKLEIVEKPKAYKRGSSLLPKSNAFFGLLSASFFLLGDDPYSPMFLSPISMYPHEYMSSSDMSCPKAYERYLDQHANDVAIFCIISELGNITNLFRHVIVTII